MEYGLFCPQCPADGVSRRTGVVNCCPLPSSAWGWSCHTCMEWPKRFGNAPVGLWACDSGLHSLFPYLSISQVKQTLGIGAKEHNEILPRRSEPFCLSLTLKTRCWINTVKRRRWGISQLVKFLRRCFCLPVVRARVAAERPWITYWNFPEVWSSASTGSQQPTFAKK